ncbi:hypothetical protein BJ138DRAFT_1149148 [Hygrophoropsis aurantiaca]|uniref:Uncharacterized protein n=1 Tax=Hygrophoropsis aurantiaca TaxID=72124 RepID=A0ACB8AG04_9AGAM|nr:hypothetical protein BJ138DRAFT_1149148 [Hygrophoropsis aurantiaca]
MSDTLTRVALVTGAAQGIGRAIALRLASDGLDVAIADLPSQKPKLDAVAEEIRSKGRRALALTVDVSVEAQVNEMVQQTASELGGLDVLVANAGRFIARSLIELTLSELDSVYDVNVKGTLLCYQAAGKLMIKQGRGGRIIGACSVAGKKGTIMSCAYASSKAAIRSLTQTFAQEVGKEGITVNAYAPGAIETELMHNAGHEMAERLGMPAGTSFVDLYVAQAAVSRYGSTEDIAGLVSFIASKESSFMTGQTLTMDGGVWMD